MFDGVSRGHGNGCNVRRDLERVDFGSMLGVLACVVSVQLLNCGFRDLCILLLGLYLVEFMFPRFTPKRCEPHRSLFLVVRLREGLLIRQLLANPLTRAAFPARLLCDVAFFVPAVRAQPREPFEPHG